jgi:hypothetical protein
MREGIYPAQVLSILDCRLEALKRSGRLSIRVISAYLITISQVFSAAIPVVELEV